MIRLFVMLAACAPLVALPARADDSALTQLAWLAGCWQAEDAEPGTGEIWMRPAGGAMLGLSRTVRGGRVVAHEFMQIRETGAERLVFIALPSGQAETAFPSATVSASEAVFENAGHDFPQRVIYRLLPDGRLAARIEGNLDGVDRAIDFPMQRVRCEDAAPVGAAGD